MDTLLCDELVQEIFNRLPPPSTAAVSLVCKRWRRLLRSSTTSLSLHFPPPYNPTTITSFSTFLTHHPYLSSLSLAAAAAEDPLLAVASSCPNLRRLRFLRTPITPSSLHTLSGYCIHLSSIAISISRPLSFNNWLPYFTSLKSLSIFITNSYTETNNNYSEVKDAIFDHLGLSLESLSLCGILPGDHGLSFLWNNCKKIKKLQLKSCESVGDYSSFSSFLKSLKGLQELELRTCRSIVDLILLKLSETCVSIESLLIYDGGSREGLLQFINQSKCRLKRLDVRLPLDLNNAHMLALSENLNFSGLVCLRLQSCCLVTGEGLRSLGRTIANGLDELSLINCDVVERESGLLTSLGQVLKRLRKLDLSYNHTLLDKELVSMLASCNNLVELKLRGCNRLTKTTLSSLVRSCKQLQFLDIMYCSRIEVDAVEWFLLNSPPLRRMEVEQNKLSEGAVKRASSKFIEIVS
ncbi:hypothetical protein ABFX02_08G008000 [Erythranthe guttata]